MQSAQPAIIPDSAYSKARAALLKGHRILLRHKSTRMLAPFLLMGKNELVNAEDVPQGYPLTAWTDGTNKFYVTEYVTKLTNQKQVNALILHENGHVFLKHLLRLAGMADQKLANQAADYAVNDFIHHLDPEIAELHPDWLYDPMFHGWTVFQIYRYLEAEQKAKQPQPGQHPAHGGGKPAPAGTKQRGEAMDHHEFDQIEKLSDEEKQGMDKAVNDALAQGSVLAGAMGGGLPVELQKSMISRSDWLRVVAEWMSSSMQGGDEYTFRKFNKRAFVYGSYLPGTETERLGCGLISFDTSGSTLGPEMEKFAGEAERLLETYPPEETRVLWWDTEVRGEQLFTPDTYPDFVKQLKPRGGGGTHAGCIDKYIRQHGIKPDFHIIMTDGYTETDIQWLGDRSVPTLWIVTLNAHFRPPFGQVVFTDKV